MREWEILFEPNKHYLTSVRPDGKAIRSKVRKYSQLKMKVKNLPQNNLYISTYPEDNIIQYIYLDFDSENDKNKALIEAKTLRAFMKTKGLNSVIIDSTNKGYHVIIQTPPINFNYLGDTKIEYPNMLFKHFVTHLIRSNTYTTLDEVNTMAGLRSNIRLIGSIHPKTNKKVQIIEGRLEEAYDDTWKLGLNYTNIILKNAFRLYKCEMRERRRAKEKYTNLNDDDLLKIDLRDVFNNLGAEPTSTFSNGYWCKSPFRADNHPSFCVTDSYYFDASTGEKGNIFSLIKDGYVKPPAEEYIRTKGAKELYGL